MHTRRKWPWLVGVAFLLSMPLLAWLSLTQRLEMAVNRALWAQGLPGAQVELTNIRFGAAGGRLLLDTVCAPDCAGRIDMAFTLSGLWRRKIDRLFIHDLSWSLPYPALTPQAGGNADWRWRQLEFQTIRLSLPGNASLVLDSGSLQPDSQGLDVHAAGRLLWAGQMLSPVRLQGTWRGQRLELDLLSMADAPSLTGKLTLHHDGAMGWSGLLALDAQGVSLAGLEGVSGTLRGEMRAGRFGGLDLHMAVPEQTGQLLRTGRAHLQLMPVSDQEPARFAGLLEVAELGLGDGPRDNRLVLPFQLWPEPAGWQLGPAETTSGSVHIPALGIAVEGLRLEGRDAAGRLALTATTLRTGKDPALLVPLRPAISLHLDRVGGLEWGLQANAPLLTLTGEGRVDLAGARHRLNLVLAHRSPPDGNRVPVAALSPWLAQWVTAVGGEFTLNLTSNPSSAAGQYQGTMALKDFALHWPGGALSGLNGRADVSAWSPLIVNARSLRVAALRAGEFTLADGTADLNLAGDGVLRLAPVAMRWHDMPVTVGPLALGLGVPLPPLPLELPPTALQKLLDALGAGALAGEGEVAGTLLLPLRDGQVAGGRLMARAAGSLALPVGADLAFLDPDRNDNLALVSEALRQFRFRRLVLEPVPQAMALRLTGVNPGFYGGYEMDLSLVLAALP